MSIPALNEKSIITDFGEIIMIFKPKILLVAILAYGATSLADDAEKEKTLDNFQNPVAVKEVLNGERIIANASWWGFDANDATQAIQGAINSGSRKVIIPYMGREWVVRPIKLAGNQEVFFEPGVVVIAKKGEFKGEYDCLFSAHGLSNITLRGYGATLKMRKEDYKSPSYPKSEHRHVIMFRGSNDVKIIGLKLESSGGDGIFIGATRDRPYTPCKNVVIEDCICDNNYRQGISVTSVDKMLIENCVLKNTIGTPPEAGIDLEPNDWVDMLVDVVVSDCIAENNIGQGFIASVSNLSEKSRDISILFVNCLARNNTGAGLWVRAVKDNGAKGLIEYRNCTSDNITWHGAWVVWEKVSSPLKLRFVDCKFNNVAKYANYVSPIELILEKERAGGQTGRIEFVNCYLYDDKNRTSVAIKDVENSRYRQRPPREVTNFGAGGGVYDVKGSINIFNRYSGRTEFEGGGRTPAFKVNSFRTQ